MRSRILSLLVILALAAGACTVGNSSERDDDLTDPVTLDRLGVDPLEDVTWRRTILGIEVVGMTDHPDPEELARIEGAIAEVPAAVWEAVPLRSIVRVSDLAGTNLHPATTAYTRGPDIYFLDRTFTEQNAGSTRQKLARVLIHELAHVAQFASLDPAYVDAILAGEITSTDTSDGSTLVDEFAAAAGWQDRSTETFAPDWDLPPRAAAGATAYGTTSPDEDMAEALAQTTMGLGDSLSTERRRWVERWLATSSDELAAGKPWIPSGATELNFVQPVYDENEVARQTVGHAEPAYYELPADSAAPAALAQRISAELRLRGMVGALERHDDPRLPRYAGRFVRRDRTAFWVELWDFRDTLAFSTKPDGPVLTYVQLW